MEDQIRSAAYQWAEALVSRNSWNVIKYYHRDAGLWGTFASKYRTGHQEIKEYFDELLLKENIRCEFIRGYIRVYQDFAFYSGTYAFSWTESGEPVKKPARFSFVYKKEFDAWLIMEHHSSLFPLID